MNGMLNGMTWEEELDLLTKFHENNLGPEIPKTGYDDGEIVINKTVVDDAHESIVMLPADGGIVRSIGRGSKISAQDDSFIAKHIEKTLGTAHRAESIFSSKTSSKSESDKKSPLKASTPATKKEGQRITTKPKLISSKKISNEETGEKLAFERNVGRGRGRKAHTATGELPVGVVANMIEKNIGRGHRTGIADFAVRQEVSRNHSTTSNNNNNATYFPKFDFGQVNRGRGSCWWGASNAVVKNNLENNKAEVGAEFGNSQKEQSDNLKVERAVLSGWTPLDDSV